jgi:hypothetical protein
VILVKSAAAVGKSTLATYIAARAGIPFLDLSRVPVSTNSLVGLLATDIVAPPNATAAFQSGDLPVVADALDEGRLLSGDANFEEFLRTSWEFLLRDRSRTDRPKLVLLGRDIAAELVDTSIQLYGEGVSYSRVTLDYFGREGAIRVIEAHASTAAERRGTEWSSSAPARATIDAFFDAIANALRLESERLWDDSQGRAFAGYAPVLGAIGTLLSDEPNPIRLRNALKEAGADRAWEVIGRVADAILTREQEEKLVPQLAKSTSVVPGPEAYDAHEQLRYLAQRAQQHPPRASSRVSLHGADADLYQRMVEQHLDEHPFLQEGNLANDVLASIVLAHGVANGALSSDPGFQLLRDASRQPFLWRSLHRVLSQSEPVWIDGRYVGCILNSVWSEAILEVNVTVRPSTEDPDLAEVTISDASGLELTFTAVHPVEFYEQLSRCEIRLVGNAVWQGHHGQTEAASFDLRDGVDFLADGALDVRATSLRLDGEIRLTAGAVTQIPNLQISVADRTSLWLGGGFAETYPWSQQRSTLDAPIDLEIRGDLERLIARCAERLPAGAPLTLTRDFAPLGDPRLGWVDREFATGEFPFLIRFLIEKELARAESAPASGPTPMIRVHFSFTWDRLLQAARNPEVADSQLAEAWTQALQAYSAFGGGAETAD